MTLVVSDNSPLNLLVRISCQEVLADLFERVVVPTEVAQEMRHEAAPAEVSDFINNPPAWLEIKSPKCLLPLLELDLGERAAISLAMELKSPLLIDERIGRRIAREHGLDVVGAVGILELAADRGLISDLQEVHAKILKLNFHVSPTILAESLARHLSR